MDNASKALIMVGAILIAVMLISLGVYLFTYARDKAEGQTEVMDSMSAAAFNEQFMSYVGPKIQGSSVKSLISKAKATAGKTHKVSVVGTKTTDAANVTASLITATKTYKVTDTTYDSNGYITVITVNGI